MDAAPRLSNWLEAIHLVDEQSLEAGLSWFERMLLALPIPVLMTETQLELPGPRITFSNAALRQLTGYTAEELLGQTPRMFQGLRTNRSVMEELKTCLQAGQRFWGETVNYTKTGTAYWVSWTIVPIFWRNQLVRYVSFQLRGSDRLTQTILSTKDEPNGSFELLFDAAEVAICLLSEEFRYVRVNRAYCELTQLCETEIVGQECFLLQEPECRSEALSGLQKALAGDPTEFAREWQLQGRNHKLQHIFTQVRLIHNLEGRRYLVITVTDLARVKREADRRLAESRFHFAVQECGLGFWDYNLRTGEVYLSPGWKQIVGYEDHELVQQHSSFQALLHPDDRPVVQRTFHQFTAGQSERYECMFRLRHKDGRYRWILSRAVALKDPRGQIYRVVGKHSDVTALQAAEQELRTNKERLDIFLRYATDTILILDAEGCRLFASDQFRAQPTPSYDRRLGESIFDQIHPDDLSEARNHLQELLASPEQPRRYSLRLLRQDGSTRWVDVTAINLLGNPAIQGILVTVRDVTEQRRLSEQLRQAQKMESLGQLAGGIAHDFNNMLSIVIGNVELALLQADPEQAARLNAVQDAAFRAVGLAQQLLGFARKRQLQLQPIRPERLLESSVQLLTFAVGSTVKVHLEPVPDATPPIRADLIALQQALVNLGINARDAMPQGGTLTLRACRADIRTTELSHPEARSGCYLRLDVQDNGTGIPADVLPKIFEPFFTTKPDGQGTGLGLPMVYGTVRQLGGWIEVESAPGRGTCFRLFLPAAQTEMDVG